MFYLETKDGDKFFTNKDSDDRKEFEKIVEDKMGEGSVNLMNLLIDESADEVQGLFNGVKHKFNDAIQALDKEMNKPEIDRVKLEEILCDLQQLYLNYFY